MTASGNYFVMTFSSTHHAMKAERILAKAEVPVTVIPVPRFITADCGIALRFEAALRESIEAKLAEEGVQFKGIYDEAEAKR